jgi:hypothetical protein
MLNPMMPEDSPAMFNNVDIQGNPTAPILNRLVNFGWEYVYHCHILSHEEMDMMRPVSVALPPVKPDGLTATITTTGSLGVSLSWNDNSIAETSYVIQRMTGTAGTWADIGTIVSPLDQVNTRGVLTFADTTAQFNTAYQYRILALNTVGYGGAFPAKTVQSMSDPLPVTTPVPSTPPAAPSNLVGTLQTGPQVNLAWTDNADNETGFVLERSVNGGAFATIASPGALAGTGGTVSTPDINVVVGNTYAYRVAAVNAAGPSAYSNTVTILVPLPMPAPANLVARLIFNPTRAQLTWTDTTNNENLFQVWRSANGGAFTQVGTVTRTATQRTATGGNVTFNNGTLTAGSTYAYYVIAVNTVPNPDNLSLPSNTATVGLTIAAAPSNVTGVAVRITGDNSNDRVTISWTDNSNNEASFLVQCSLAANFSNPMNFTAAANATSIVQTVSRNFDFYCRVRAANPYGNSAWSNVVFVTTP